MGFPIPRLLSAWDLFPFFLLLLLRRSFLSSPIHHDPLGREERMNIGEIVENIQRQVSSSFFSLIQRRTCGNSGVDGCVCVRARLPHGEKDWCSTIIIQEGFLLPSLFFSFEDEEESSFPILLIVINFYEQIKSVIFSICLLPSLSLSSFFVFLSSFKRISDEGNLERILKRERRALCH